MCIIYLICCVLFDTESIKINSTPPPLSFKLSFQRLLNRCAVLFKVLSEDFSTSEREQLF